MQAVKQKSPYQTLKSKKKKVDRNSHLLNEDPSTLREEMRKSLLSKDYKEFSVKAGLLCDVVDHHKMAEAVVECMNAYGAADAAVVRHFGENVNLTPHQVLMRNLKKMKSMSHLLNEDIPSLETSLSSAFLQDDMQLCKKISILLVQVLEANTLACQVTECMGAYEAADAAVVRHFGK